MENWRKIRGFDYEVSDSGKVRTLSGQPRKLVKLKNGYLTVILRKDNKSYCRYVHRLVATEFIENHNNYPCVNHLDKDRENNHVSNLEWCTAKWNVQYSLAKRVRQYTMDGSLVKEWICVRDAERELGWPHGLIDRCATGKIKQTHGFIFEYVME